MTVHRRTAPAYLLCLLLSGLAGAAKAHESRLPANLEEMSAVEVGEGVYVIHGMQALPDGENKGFMSNSAVVLTEEGAVIIDSGGGHEIGVRILELTRGLTDKPVVAVFNSHIHGDHWLGNAAIREAFPDVRIYAHERAIERLRQGEAQDWVGIMSGMTGEQPGAEEALLPSDGLQGSEEIEIGERLFKSHHTGRAHTDSDLMIELPASRVLFAGDIIEHGRAVSSDVPQDFDAKGQIQAIRYSLELPIDIYVPGHGMTGGREVAEDALRFLEILYASVAQYYEEGMLDYEMRDLVAQDLSEFSGWFNFDDLGRLISYVYQQIEFAEFE